MFTNRVRQGIADFGLSEIKSHATSSLAIQTAQGANAQEVLGGAGTLRYMSPETLRGQVGKAGDVYAYAMTTFEVRATQTLLHDDCLTWTVFKIFTNTPPFLLVPDAAIYVHIAVEKTRLTRPVGPEVINRGLNDQLWSLIWECSDPEASQRPEFSTISKAAGRLADERQSLVDQGLVHLEGCTTADILDLIDFDDSGSEGVESISGENDPETTVRPPGTEVPDQPTHEPLPSPENSLVPTPAMAANRQIEPVNGESATMAIAEPKQRTGFTHDITSAAPGVIPFSEPAPAQYRDLSLLGFEVVGTRRDKSIDKLLPSSSPEFLLDPTSNMATIRQTELAPVGTSIETMAEAMRGEWRRLGLDRVMTRNNKPSGSQSSDKHWHRPSSSPNNASASTVATDRQTESTLGGRTTMIITQAMRQTVPSDPDADSPAPLDFPLPLTDGVTMAEHERFVCRGILCLVAAHLMGRWIGRVTVRTTSSSSS